MISLDPVSAGHERDERITDQGFPFYTGSQYQVGTATGPVVEPSFAVSALIPSWNSDTPAGSWLEVLVRVRIGQTWSAWYNLGVWASDDTVLKRHSVANQRDESGSVDTDTLRLKTPAGAFQVMVRLFSADGHAIPALRLLAMAYSDPKPVIGGPGMVQPTRGDMATRDDKATRDSPVAWGRVIDAVPQCSQMVYPDGGNVWCSPTALSMVLGYWQGGQGPCETRVRQAVAGVYDAVYGGHGNWSFNVAYAGAVGYKATVVRFAALADLEPWIVAGVPVVLSVSWNNAGGPSLVGAPVGRSAGHLTLLVGFDTSGNPVMNEPAAPSDQTVRRVYDRLQLEHCWLGASGGAAYLITPRNIPWPALPGDGVPR
jgi:hypothetical protein